MKDLLKIILLLLTVYSLASAIETVIRSPRAEQKYLQSLVDKARARGEAPDPHWQSRLDELGALLAPPAYAPPSEQAGPGAPVERPPLSVTTVNSNTESGNMLQRLAPDIDVSPMTNAVSPDVPDSVGHDERDHRSLDQGNDTCPATVISALPYEDVGTNNGRADNFSPGTNNCGIVSTGGRDVIFQYTAAGTGSYSFGVVGTSPQHYVCYLRTGGACPGSSTVSCDTTIALGNNGWLYYVTLTGGVTYYIILDGVTASDDVYHFTARRYDQTDACPARVISAVPFTDLGTTIRRSNNFAPEDLPDNCYIPPSNNARDVIYQYTPADTGYYAAIVCSYFSTSFGAYNPWDGICYCRTGGACPGSSQVSCEDERDCAQGVGFWALLNGGQTYYFIVDGAGSQYGDYAFTLQTQCIPRQCDITECTETPGPSHPANDCDGGTCDSLFGGTPQYGNLLLGQSVCGQLFGYFDGSINNQDADWYRFTLVEPCSVSVSLLSTYSTSIQVGAYARRCAALTYTSAASNCEPRIMKTPCLPAGDYQILLIATLVGPTSTPQPYQLVVNAIPCSGCSVDSTVQAPFAGYAGPPQLLSTCGKGNHCSFQPGEDITIRVNIPSAGFWGFSICNYVSAAWNSHIYLTSQCCNPATLIAENDNSNGCAGGLSQLCVHLNPGTYYLTIESMDGTCSDAINLQVLPCSGSCCYGDPLAPSCAVDSLPTCNALGGSWTIGATCNSSTCYPLATCPDAFWTAPPDPPNWTWTAFVSDVEVFGSIYDDFYNFGGEPITGVTFYGIGADIHDGNLPCAESPQTFNIRFFQDTIYWDYAHFDTVHIPGRLVCNYNMTLTGTPTYYYGPYTQYKWDVTLPTTCSLYHGWLSIFGTGHPECSFFWSGELQQGGNGDEFHFERTSFPGHYEDIGLAFCLRTTVLPAAQVDSLVIRPTPNNPGFVTLYWNSSRACTANIYSSTNTVSDYPTNFVLVATESSAIGSHTSSPISVTGSYSRFVVTLDNCAP